MNKDRISPKIKSNKKMNNKMNIQNASLQSQKVENKYLNFRKLAINKIPIKLAQKKKNKKINLKTLWNKIKNPKPFTKRRYNNTKNKQKHNLGLKVWIGSRDYQNQNRIKLTPKMIQPLSDNAVFQKMPSYYSKKLGDKQHQVLISFSVMQNQGLAKYNKSNSNLNRNKYKKRNRNLLLKENKKLLKVEV